MLYFSPQLINASVLLCKSENT